MFDSLEKKVASSLRKAMGVDIEEAVRPPDKQEWWDGLAPAQRLDILKQLGFKKGGSKFPTEFDDLQDEWKSEVEAYWKKHVLVKAKKKYQGESVLGERFSSGDVRAAGKEAMAALGKLSAADETFVKSRIKTTAWKKVTAAIDEIHADAQKKGKKVGKQDVANVLAMMIRQGIEKETT